MFNETLLKILKIIYMRFEIMIQTSSRYMLNNNQDNWNSPSKYLALVSKPESYDEFLFVSVLLAQGQKHMAQENKREHKELQLLTVYKYLHGIPRSMVKDIPFN